MAASFSSIAHGLAGGVMIGCAALAKLGGAPVDASFPSIPYLVIGGLFVGFGARLGSGCTSGHGVCGVSRLSRRSLVATAAFMAAGMLTVAAMRACGVLS